MIEDNFNIKPLLKRAFMFLEDKKFELADEYAERVLDMDPENTDAYLVKLLANQHCKKKEELTKITFPFENDENYKKILRFGSDEIKAELKLYIDYIIERNKNKTYEMADNFASKDTISELEKAICFFELISDWKDANHRLKKCQNRLSELKSKIEKENIEKMEKKRKLIRKWVCFFSILCICGIIGLIVISNIRLNEVKTALVGKTFSGTYRFPEHSVTKLSEEYIEVKIINDNECNIELIIDDYFFDNHKHSKYTYKNIPYTVRNGLINFYFDWEHRSNMASYAAEPFLVIKNDENQYYLRTSNWNSNVGVYLRQN